MGKKLETKKTRTLIFIASEKTKGKVCKFVNNRANHIEHVGFQFCINKQKTFCDVYKTSVQVIEKDNNTE